MVPHGPFLVIYFCVYVILAGMLSLQGSKVTSKSWCGVCVCVCVCVCVYSCVVYAY